MKAKDELAPCCEHHVTDIPSPISLPDELHFTRLAELYKVFGDKTRVKILYALLQRELCVCEISAAVGMSVSAVSHQLKTLKLAHLIAYRRKGKSVIYALADNHVSTVLHNGFDHISEILP